jgi:hypothetical protein
MNDWIITIPLDYPTLKTIGFLDDIMIGDDWSIGLPSGYLT